MSSGSVRLHVPVDLHQHEAPPEAEHAALPDPREGDDGAARTVHGAGRLWREDGRVMYRDARMEEAEAVRVLWARPLSGRGGPVSIMKAGKKRELAYVSDVDELDDESRRIAMEELAGGAVLPVIHAVRQVLPRFGNYYWDVETDMGRRTFLLASPENNTFRPRPDAVVLKDVSGNCYEIASVAGLSKASRHEMERVL